MIPSYETMHETLTRRNTARMGSCDGCFDVVPAHSLEPSAEGNVCEKCRGGGAPRAGKARDAVPSYLFRDIHGA
jgi:hypothetical protein